MITDALRAKAEDLMRIECVDRAAWQAVMRELLDAHVAPIDERSADGRERDS